MNTAERLIARHGIDAVSVRDITAAAKTDVTAIHYHFGSKDQLIKATLLRALEESNLVRGPLIDELDAKDRPSMQDIARCLVLPARHHAAAASAKRHRIAVISIAARHPDYVALVAVATEKDIGRYLAALERAQPGTPRSTLLTRLNYAITLAQHSQDAHPLRQSWINQHGVGTEEDPIERLVDFIAGGLAGGR